MTKALDLAKFGRETAPLGDILGTTDTQTLSAKTFSDMPVFSSGVANAVPYLSGTKVLTTDAALTFNGTTLVVAGSVNSTSINTGDVLASGNVGVGTTLPSYKLDVKDGAIRVNNSLSTDADLRFANNVSTAGKITYSSQDMAFTTGGSEKFRITSAGNVAIGTDAPATKLVLAGNNTLLAANNTLRFWDIDTATQTDQQVGKIEFYSSDANAPGPSVKAYLGAFADDTSPGVYLAFATDAETGTATEKLRITSAGNVGIGTSAPSYKLQVSGGSASASNFVISTEATSNAGTFGFTNANGPAIQVFGSATGNSGALVALTAGTERMRIDSSGNVSIGNNSVASNTLRYLDVFNADTGASAGSIIRIVTSNVAATGNTTVDIVKYKNGAFLINNNETNANAYTGFNVGASERMRIDSSGNVGLGKTAVDKTLELYSASNTALRIQNSTTGQGGSDGLLIEQSGLDSQIVNYEAGNLKFFTSGAERARFLSNGTLKLGMSGGQSRSDSGVASWNVVGTTGNNNSLSFDITVPYDEGSSVGHHIEANMTHYNWGGYGCILDTWVATRGTSITEQINLVNVTSGNGGSWTVTKPNATTLRVTKNAGSYGGGGYYWIKVTTVSVI